MRRLTGTSELVYQRRAFCWLGPMLPETHYAKSGDVRIAYQVAGGGPFDLVFTTWGTICWLPDVKDWARIVASVLAPGGELYFADAHPGFNVLEEVAGKLVPAYDFQTPADRPLHFVNETTYTGDPTIMSHPSTREWIHSLSAVLGGLIDAGLAITAFREHEVMPWRGLTCLVPASEGMWRLPDGVPRIPLSYSVRAKKGA